MLNPDFWRGQRILLTGHTGFKGSWLSLWLARLGAHVSGFSLPPETDPNLFGMIDGSIFEHSVLADIRDLAAVRAAVDAARPDIVLHLAAQPLVRRSYRIPVETVDANVMGTANLLEALRDQPQLKAILVVTTDKVYRNLDDGRAFREDDPLGSHDPYSASKAAAEIVTSSFAQSYFSHIPVVTARAGNVIGGGDWSEDRLVPDIWRAIHQNKSLTLRNPASTRPWQHVVEPLYGYLRYVEAALAGPVPQALNFGPYPSDTVTVSVLAETMLAAMKKTTSWTKDDAPTPPEMQLLSLDPSLAGKTIGWTPRLESNDAITWTADWFGRLAAGESATALCLEQISRYEDRT